MRVQTSESTLTIDGHRLQVCRVRSADPLPMGRPVLVLLHEALGSITLWKQVPQLLAQRTGCEVLVYERFGHGYSAPLPAAARGGDYLDYEAYAVLPQLLAQCGVERPLLVGHSDGATLALMFAARHPREVAGVVSEAAHLFVEERTLAGIRETQRTAEASRLLERLRKYHRDPEPIFRRWVELWQAPRFAAWNIEALMPAITCPVLAIQGEEDEYGTLRQLDAIVDGVSGPADRLVIPGCRHVPHFQAQSDYLAAVARFVAEI